MVKRYRLETRYREIFRVNKITWHGISITKIPETFAALLKSGEIMKIIKAEEAKAKK